MCSAETLINQGFQRMLEFFIELHSHIMAPERIPLALGAIFAAVLIGVISGPWFGNANPFLWQVVDVLFGKAGDRLNRTHRSHGDLVFRGFCLTALVLVAVFFLGKHCAVLVLQKPLYGLTEIFFLLMLISAGSVWFTLLRLYAVLEKKQTGQGAYYAIARSTRTNLAVVDDFAVTRAGMGFAARAFDKGLVAPVFWYLIGGLPVALMYSALAALAWRFGKDGFSKGFGDVPLAALLIVCASIVTPSAGIVRSVAGLFGVRNRAPYEQGGFALSALAWSLNVVLGGASQDLAGSAIHGAWVGPEGATAKIDHTHLRRAIYISATAHLLFVFVLVGAYLWAQL